MQTDVYIALINPCMAVIFSVTFMLLWQQRRRRYIAVLGVSFLLLACGFLLQFFAPFGMEASRLLSNFFFLGGGVGLAAGALGRHGRKLPALAIGAFAIGGFASFCWFLFVEPDLNWRILSINFAFGAISLALVAELRSVKGRQNIDNVMIGIVLVWGISFFPRPVLVLWLDGPYQGYEGFHQSLYWITLTLSASLFLLLFALTAITAIVLDVMSELRHESQTDALSGLHNRRGFEEETAELLRTAARRGTPVTLVVCDLDHFKAVNDTYGHACGDSVIVAFANCLRNAAGPNHVIGRIGGEEFAVLIQGGDSASGRLLAEGVRSAFSSVPVPGLPEDLRSTASFGVAEWSEGESVSTLFSQADRALYDAKKAGRDCVRVADHDPLIGDRRRYRSQAAVSYP